MEIFWKSDPDRTKMSTEGKGSYEPVKKIDEMKRDTRKAEESSKKSKSAMEDF